MMYESVILDIVGYSEIHQFTVYADEESSETDLMESEDSTDTSEEENENVNSEGSGSPCESNEDSDISSSSSGSDLSVDHNSDFDDMLSDRWEDSEPQEDEETSRGTESDFESDPGSGERGDIDDEDDFGDLFEYQFNDESEELYEDDGESELEESGEESENNEYSSETGTGFSADFESDSIDFYNRTLESLGIIAGCLFFIAFTIILKYIYKFFRLFI